MFDIEGISERVESDKVIRPSKKESVKTTYEIILNQDHTLDCLEGAAVFVQPKSL